MMVMALAQAAKKNNKSCVSNDVKDILFEKLDEAIDDLKYGRVQTIDEAWEEIDAL